MIYNMKQSTDQRKQGKPSRERKQARENKRAF